jgi:hypothetical protein
MQRGAHRDLFYDSFSIGPREHVDPAAVDRSAGHAAM